MGEHAPVDLVRFSYDLDATLVFVNSEGTGDFQTIQAALDAALNGWTIALIDGIFTGPGNRDLSLLGKRITLRSESGDPVTCTIDCQGTEAESHRGFIFESGETAEALVDGISVVNGWAAEGAVAKFTNSSSPTFRNCRFIGNTAAMGGAVHASGGAEPSFEHCLVAGNSASLGGGIFTDNANAAFVNCTIADNQSAAASIVAFTSSLSFRNTIIAFNGPGASIFSSEATAELECCDVYGNEGGNYVDAFASHWGDSTNISMDPLFCQSAPLDYALVQGSICLSENPGNPCGELIGAYGMGEGCDLTAAEDGQVLPTAMALYPNYPNPFNPTTQIVFELPRPSQIEVALYDLSGRLVRALAQGLRYDAGHHAIEWNGTDDAGHSLPSGVYLCRLEAGGKVETRKLALVK